MNKYEHHQEEQPFYQTYEEDFLNSEDTFESPNSHFADLQEQGALLLVPNPDALEENLSFWTTLQELKKYGIYEMQYSLLLIIYWGGSFYFDYLNFLVIHLAFVSSAFYFGIKLCEDYYAYSEERTLLRMCSHHFLVIILMMSTLLAALMFFEGNAY